MQLVKTIGGHNGAPQKCFKCGSQHFNAVGMAWACTECGHYVPATLSDLKKNLEKMQVLHGNLKTMIEGLERLVKHTKENR